MGQVQGQVCVRVVCVCVCVGRGGGGGITEHIEITLPFAKLCYAFEEKLFFSVTIIL